MKAFFFFLLIIGAIMVATVNASCQQQLGQVSEVLQSISLNSIKNTTKIV